MSVYCKIPYHKTFNHVVSNHVTTPLYLIHSVPSQLTPAMYRPDCSSLNEDDTTVDDINPACPHIEHATTIPKVLVKEVMQDFQH